MSNPRDCGGDVAAYLLGALEPAEAQRFERHLAGCAICREEIESLRGVVQALPMAAPPHRAPRRLRRRVVRAVRRQQTAAGGRHRWPALRSLPRSAPRAALGGVAAVAATAVVVLAALGAFSPSGPSIRVIQAQVVGVSGRAQLRLAGGHGELIVRHMTPPPPGHVYEVWLAAAHRPPMPTSVLFSVTATGAATVGLPESLRGIREVMVTPEPDGGSLVPTHTPVIVVELS